MQLTPVTAKESNETSATVRSKTFLIGVFITIIDVVEWEIFKRQLFSVIEGRMTAPGRWN